MKDKDFMTETGEGDYAESWQRYYKHWQDQEPNPDNPYLKDSPTPAWDAVSESLRNELENNPQPLCRRQQNGLD